jgi:hypothetical protein
VKNDPTRRNTSWRGDVTESQVAAPLTAAGHRLLRPLSSAARYDLAIDNGDASMMRIQCKTGVLRSGSIVFRAYSVSGHNTRGVPYHGDIDAFGVYCPANRGVYLIPITAIPHARGMVCLRIDEAKNGQRHGIRWAAEFTIR